MKYENRAYWEELHRLYSGRLQAVGHPQLSERFNQLKYQSESHAFLEVLEGIAPNLRDRSPVRVLDIGAGTGFWTELAHRWFRDHGAKPESVALDMSAGALEVLRKQCPWARVVQEDLRTVDPLGFASAFDLVTVCYCLHHIVRVNHFVNALRFAANSVAPGGFLLLMDPVLTRPFSPFTALDFPFYSGSGIPRPLHFLDDMLSDLQMDRVARRVAVSFLLNGPIEGRSRFQYALCTAVWRAAKLLGRYESPTRLFARFLAGGDAMLKHLGLDFSSSLCVYRKRRKVS